MRKGALTFLIAALILGAGSSMALPDVLKHFQEGLGATLGGTAGVIGLGVMLGKLLAESNGAEILAQRFNAFFGPQRVGWCIMALALAVGLTTWFAVGLILLLPILLTLTRETKRPFLLLAIPLLSCLSVMHGLMPPHPGPVIAIDYAKAKVDSYTETGDAVLSLNVDSLSYKSLRDSVGMEVRGDFEGGGAQLRPFASAVIEKDFTGDERTVHFAQTSAPTIVNSFAFDDASKSAYGRIGLGFNAQILTSVSLDVAGSATVGKDQGEETSAQVGFRFSF